MTGSSTSTLRVPATESRNGQKYRCVITDGCGKTITSNAATLKVKSSVLEITSQPSSLSVEEGQSARFAVAASGNGLSYQWQYKTADGGWKNCSRKTEGYNSSVLKVEATALRNGYQYRCIITDSMGKTVTSNAAVLTVITIPIRITAQPSSVSMMSGQTAKFSISAAGNSLKYQWQYQSPGTAVWKNSGMTGNTSAILSVPVTEGRNNQKYRCIVSDNSGNSVTSETATLSVYDAIAITIQPSDITSSEGKTVKLFVKATGTALNYQWQYCAPGSTTWKNSGMTGNMTTILSIPVTRSRNGQQYRCVITDGYGDKAISDSAKLIVLD